MLLGLADGYLSVGDGGFNEFVTHDSLVTHLADNSHSAVLLVECTPRSFHEPCAACIGESDVQTSLFKHEVLI